jgi:hypothetical protein
LIKHRGTLSNLNGSLKEVPLEEEKIIKKVETFYEEKTVESPGVESEDFAQTILNPIQPPKKIWRTSLVYNSHGVSN